MSIYNGYNPVSFRNILPIIYFYFSSFELSGVVIISVLSLGISNPSYTIFIIPISTYLSVSFSFPHILPTLIFLYTNKSYRFYIC